MRVPMMPKSPTFHLSIPALLGVALLGGQLMAQDASDPSREPDPKPPVAEKTETPPAEVPPVIEEDEDEEEAPPPSLDDLLGIEEGADTDDAESIAEAERQRNLERALGEEEPTDAFKSAVNDMQESANLLRDSRSTGLGTQRLQARIVERLQILIEQSGEFWMRRQRSG